MQCVPGGTGAVRRGGGVARAGCCTQAGAGGAAARPRGPNRGGGGALQPVTAGEEAPAAQHTGNTIYFFYICHLPAQYYIYSYLMKIKVESKCEGT